MKSTKHTQHNQQPCKNSDAYRDITYPSYQIRYKKHVASNATDSSLKTLFNAAVRGDGCSCGIDEMGRGYMQPVRCRQLEYMFVNMFYLSKKRWIFIKYNIY